MRTVQKLRQGVRPAQLSKTSGPRRRRPRQDAEGRRCPGCLVPLSDRHIPSAPTKTMSGLAPEAANRGRWLRDRCRDRLAAHESVSQSLQEDKPRAVAARRLEGGAGIARGAKTQKPRWSCRSIDRRFSRVCEGVLPSFIRLAGCNVPFVSTRRPVTRKNARGGASENGMWARAVETPKQRCRPRPSDAAVALTRGQEQNCEGPNLRSAAAASSRGQVVRVREIAESGTSPQQQTGDA